MAGRRALAFFAALVMVGGAIGVRALIDDGGGGTKHEGEKPVLLCAVELGRVCAEMALTEDVEVVEESARVTAERLASLPDEERQSEPYDGWVAFARDIESVREARRRAQLARVLETPSDTIARTPLVFAIWRDRAEALASECQDITWKCVGDVAGQAWRSIGGQAAWGDVKPGHADPGDTGEGLAVIGQAAAQYLGRTDLSRDDFDDDEFLEWFSRLERSVRGGGGVGEDSPIVRMLTAGPAAFDIVATTEAVAGPLLAAASPDRRQRVRLLYPAPVATADVAFATFVDGNEDLFDIVTGGNGRRALAHAGFRVDGEDRAKGVPTTPALPSRSNLPSAGALEALLTTWREVTG